MSFCGGLMQLLINASEVVQYLRHRGLQSSVFLNPILQYALCFGTKLPTHSSIIIIAVIITAYSLLCVSD